MGIDLTSYTMTDALNLHNKVEEVTTKNTDTVKKEELIATVVDGQIAGLIKKGCHQTTANTLQELGVKRDECLAFLAVEVPNWPVKNPEARKKNHIPWAKDSEAVKDHIKAHPEFVIFKNGIQSFNQWLYRTYEAGTWDEKVIAPKTIKDGKNPPKNNNNNDKGQIEIEKPSDEQLATLSGLEIITLFLNMATSNDKISADSKEMASELCKVIASELEPELAEKINQ